MTNKKKIAYNKIENNNIIQYTTIVLNLVSIVYWKHSGKEANGTNEYCDVVKLTVWQRAGEVPEDLQLYDLLPTFCT